MIACHLAESCETQEIEYLLLSLDIQVDLIIRVDIILTQTEHSFPIVLCYRRKKYLKTLERSCSEQWMQQQLPTSSRNNSRSS